MEIRIKKTCPYNDIEIDCDESGKKSAKCLACGWNPVVARERKKKARDNILKKDSKTFFVYGIGDSEK